MALGSDVKKQIKPEELEELLNGLDRLLDRTKVLYEQYFMGIQKLAPLQLHRDAERKVRELMQAQIRNTALRFRLTTLSQKFGAYSTYWKRTLREIEQGRYVRDLARVKRKADQLGEELPDELLVKLPKLAQDRIRRDRERMGERAQRDAELGAGAHAASAGDVEPGPDDGLALHEISEDEAQTLFTEHDLDLDNLFQALTDAPVPEGTPVPGATRAAPEADASDIDDSADVIEPDTAAWPPEPQRAEEADADVRADASEGEESHLEASQEPGLAALAAAAPAGPGESSRAKGRTVTLPLGKAIAANRSAAPAPPVFRVPLPPGTSPRGGATSPEQPVPAPPVLPRTATGQQTPPQTPPVPRTATGQQTPQTPPVPRTMTQQAPPAPRTATGPQTPPAPRTMTGQQTPPLPAETGPQTPPAPRTMTGQQTPPVPRTATGQQTPPVPRTATGQHTPPARAATGQPTPPRTMTGQQTPPPRAATPPPTPRAAAARRADPPPPPSPDLPPGMDDRQCRELYARYLKARQLVGESNDDVTYERLVTSLSKQATAIMTQHSARGVQFHVVVRGDKVVLKAKPLKPGKDE